MKKIIKYFKEKSKKQRIVICIVLAVFLILFFFTIKVNFLDIPLETEEAKNEPQFHVNLADAGLLLAVIIIYSVHKIREKRKQGRL